MSSGFSALGGASILDVGTVPHQPPELGEQPIDTVAIMIPIANEAINTVGLYLFTRRFQKVIPENRIVAKTDTQNQR